LEVLAQDNYKKTTANGVGNLGSGQSQKDNSEWRWKSWLSQDLQRHSMWSFCDCPEPRLPTPFAVVYV
jgi:hypothetical protein